MESAKVNPSTAVHRHVRRDVWHSPRSNTARLRTLQRERGAGAAFELLNAIAAENMEVNVIHYNIVISAWAAEGDLAQAIETFAQMGQCNVQASVVSYGAICSAHTEGWHHGIHVLQQLQCDSMEPNAILLTSVAAALQQGQKWHVAIGTLRALTMRQVLANVISTNSVANASAKAVQWLAALAQISDMFKANLQADSASTVASCRVASWVRTFEVLKKAVMTNIRSSQTMVNSGAAACADASLWKEVLRQLGWIASRCLEQTVVSFNTALSACGNLWSQALGVFQATVQQLRPNVVTCNSCIDAFDPGRWHFSLAMAHKMSFLQILPDQLTRNCLISSQTWRLGLRFLKDVLGFNAAISSCERSGHWWDAMDLFTSLLASGSLRPSLVSQNAVLSACKQGSQWQTALSFMRLWSTARRPQDRFSYNTSISACGNLMSWAEALQCFSSMCCLIRPDLVAYNSASHASGVAKAWEHSLQLFHEAAMVKELDPAAYGTVVMATGSVSSWWRSLLHLQDMKWQNFHLDTGIISSAVCGCEKSWEQFRPQRIMFPWALSN